MGYVNPVAGVPFKGSFQVLDLARKNPISGLAPSSFNTTLAVNGTASSVPVTISEIGNGLYLYTFTPNVAGAWFISITHSVYNARGWIEDIKVAAGGPGGGSGVSREWFLEWVRRNQPQIDATMRLAEERDEEMRALLVLHTLGIL